MYGYPIGAISESDLPQMGQIRDFFRSDYGTFWLTYCLNMTSVHCQDNNPGVKCKAVGLIPLHFLQALEMRRVKTE